MNNKSSFRYETYEVRYNDLEELDMYLNKLRERGWRAWNVRKSDYVEGLGGRDLITFEINDR